jgi:hypothetical protein
VRWDIHRFSLDLLGLRGSRSGIELIQIRIVKERPDDIDLKDNDRDDDRR